MTDTITEPYGSTARERRFLADVEQHRSRGGTVQGIIGMLEALDATDRAAAFKQLLAEATNPLDRQLYQAGLDVLQGGAA
jgi:hypothetical protein